MIKRQAPGHASRQVQCSHPLPLTFTHFPALLVPHTLVHPSFSASHWGLVGQGSEMRLTHFPLIAMCPGAHLVQYGLPRTLPQTLHFDGQGAQVLAFVLQKLVLHSLQIQGRR